MSRELLEGDCREILIIIHDGKGQRRYKMPHLIARDLENWLRWAEKHGGAKPDPESVEISRRRIEHRAGMGHQMDLFGGG